MCDIYKYWDIEDDEFRVLIHSNSIMNCTDNERKKLKWLSEYSVRDFIDIAFTPSDEPEVLSFFRGHNIESIFYTIINGVVVLKYKNDEKSGGCVINMNNNKCENINSKSKVLNYDMFYSDSLYNCFFIVSNYEKNNIRASFVVNIDEAFYYLSLFLIRKQLFYISPHSKVDSFLYYLYKSAKEIPNLQEKFSIAIYSKDNELLDSLQSLHNRLHFILKAMDVLEYSLFQKCKSNDDDFVYHFSYLNILMTGVLDDLARIFVHIYKMEFKNRMSVSLRVLHGKDKSPFSKSVFGKREEIAEYIEREATKRIINLIYLIRDKVQHQEFLKIEKYKSYDMEIEELKCCNMIDLHYFLEINVIKRDSSGKLNICSKEYLTVIAKRFFQIIRDLVDFIDLDEQWNRVDIDRQKKIKADKVKIRKGLGNFYNWGNDAYLVEYKYT